MCRGLDMAQAELDPQVLAQVSGLLEEHASVLDSDDLESWPTLFTPEGQYRVLSRENEALGLAAPLVYYYSQGMLKDRVTALRDALTYEYVYTRHVNSPARVAPRPDGDWDVKSNFAIYQSTEQGVTRTFAVGCYEDVITRTAEGLKFRKRDVILDSFAVLNNIAVPL